MTLAWILFLHCCIGSYSQTAKLQIQDDLGSISFGLNSDTFLYRNGINQLQTDGSFSIAGTLNAGNIITSPVTIFVGPSRSLKSFQDSVTFLQNKLLLAPVTVQFDCTTPTTFLMPALTIQKMASPAQINFQGNLLTPTYCILQQNDTNDPFLTFTGAGAYGIQFSGFQLVSVTNNLKALSISDGAFVTAQDHSLQIEGFLSGISCSTSMLTARYLIVNNFLNVGVLAGTMCTVDVSYSIFSGQSSSSGMGVIASYNTLLVAYGINISHVHSGIVCYYGSWVTTHAISFFNDVGTPFNCDGYD